MGPSLLRWLPRSLGQLTEKAAEQTVRTVALIGGDEAFALLGGYVDDPRDRVIEALIHAWSYFDADAYADSILSRLPLAGREVIVTHSGQVGCLGRLGSLTHLRIEHPIREVSFLSELSPLESLWITGLEGGDLSVLRAHSGLRELMLFGVGSMISASVVADLAELVALAIPVSSDLDLNILPSLPNLVSVSLAEITADTDLSPVSRISGLKNFHLVALDDDLVAGLEVVEELKNLTSLSLYWCDVNAWLAMLNSALPSLTQLHLYGCSLPADPLNFKKLVGLRWLSIVECYAADGTPITALKVPGVGTEVVAG